LSQGTTHLDLPSLTSGVPAKGDAAYRQSFYYRLDVSPQEAGETIVVKFGTNNTGVANELYVRRNGLPSRGTFDIRSAQGSSSNQWLVISNARPGTYCILAIAAPDNSHIGPLSTYTLQADGCPRRSTDLLGRTQIRSPWRVRPSPDG
jgi:hypothetical protein